MYFQNYFADKYMKLEIFPSQEIFRVVSDISRFRHISLSGYGYENVLCLVTFQVLLYFKGHSILIVLCNKTCKSDKELASRCTIPYVYKQIYDTIILLNIKI